MDWTEETIVRLRGLWAEGHSTAEIGRRFGVTKNAIVGKAHRLELPARPSPIRRDGVSGAQPRRPVPRRTAGPTLPPLSSTSPAPGQPAPLALASAFAIAGAASLASAMPALPEIVRSEMSQPESGLPEFHRLEPARADPRPAEIARPAPPVMASQPPRIQAEPRPYARSLTCCWPIGEPGTKSFHFCDNGATPGKPYCGQHAAVAYVKIRDRREVAA